MSHVHNYFLRDLKKRNLIREQSQQKDIIFGYALLEPLHGKITKEKLTKAKNPTYFLYLKTAMN